MKLSTFILLLVSSICTFSQVEQPKIGLVLSGGGAKGFAHIGILKEIDRAGLQLDYIGGTSMGAIVGGLYAIGYSSAQIEEIINDSDFNTLLRDEIPRSAIPFFDKENHEKTILTLPITKKGIRLPKAISKGQNILNLLLELLAPAEHITNFSKLPIPFYCIATDAENGNEVLLEEGSLPLALRASASFPTLLNPVNLHSKLLIDGGIANNFPVEIMKSKGVDYVIGVDVEGKLIKKDQLKSVIEIMNQIVSYQMYKKSDQEKNLLDLYIHPEVNNYQVVDFNKKKEIIALGVQEAAKYRNVFEELAHVQKRSKIRPTKTKAAKIHRISTIEVNGNKNYTRAYVLGKLNIIEGDVITRKEITQKIQLLSATKNYANIMYHLTQQKDSSYALQLSLQESKANTNLSLGMHYDHLYKSSVLANITKKHLLINNDLLSLDVILGDNLRYNFHYFVDNGFYTSFGIKSRYNHFTTNTNLNPLVAQFPNVNSLNLNYSDITNQLYIQTAFNRIFALGAGIEHKYIKATTETISNNNRQVSLDNSHYFNLLSYLKLDTYDKNYFATKGYFADLNFKWYLASSDYNNNFTSFAQAKGTLGFATTFFKRLTFKNTNEVGFTLNTPQINVFNYHVGGYNKNYINTFISFYGYDFSEISDKSFLKSELEFSYQFANKHYALFIANYARLDTNVFKNIDLFKNTKSGYALGYSYNSFIGPLEIKYAWSPEQSTTYWLFNLGFWF